MHRGSRLRLRSPLAHSPLPRYRHWYPHNATDITRQAESISFSAVGRTLRRRHGQQVKEHAIFATRSVAEPGLLPGWNISASATCTALSSIDNEQLELAA